MNFRGKQWTESGRLPTGLILGLIIWMGSVGVLPAETTPQNMTRYRSTLNFAHDYPRAWQSVDRSNTAAARADLLPAGADSIALANSHTNFILNQIDSLEIKAAFLENTEGEDSGTILVNLGPQIDKFDTDAMNLLEQRFQTMLLPPGAMVKNLETSVVRQGLKKMLVLTASVTERGRPDSWSYHSLTLNGEGRSLTFTLRGTEAAVRRLQPVLADMAGTLEDNFNVTRGLSRMPRLAEIALIVLFSLLISWLIIRLRNQLGTASRHRRRGITFFSAVFARRRRFGCPFLFNKFLPGRLILIRAGDR